MARSVEGAWYRASKGTWYATVDGVARSLGVKGEGNKAEATAAWHRLMAGQSADQPKPEAKPQGLKNSDSCSLVTAKSDDFFGKSSLTVRQLADAFLADASSRLKPKTENLYGYEMDRLCKSLGTVKADCLTTNQLTQWLRGLNLSNGARSIAIRAVASVFSWAVRTQLVATNPAKDVSKPRSQSRSQEAVISEADHKLLVANASPSFRQVLRFLHATGCRPGEVSMVTAENFDANACLVKLVDHKTAVRTGKPRFVFLPPDMCKLLKAQAKRFKTGSLFRTVKGTAWNARAITVAMRLLARKVGVNTIAYGYRHTFATAALSQGIPDAHVAALLGHSSTSMLHRHYSHLTSQATVLRQAVARVR